MAAARLGVGIVGGGGQTPWVVGSTKNLLRHQVGEQTQGPRPGPMVRSFWELTGHWALACPLGLVRGTVCALLESALTCRAWAASPSPGVPARCRPHCLSHGNLSVWLWWPSTHGSHELLRYLASAWGLTTQISPLSKATVVGLCSPIGDVLGRLCVTVEWCRWVPSLHYECSLPLVLG